MKFSFLLVTAFLSLTTTGMSGLVIGFDPADLEVTSTGMDQIVDIGILVEWDGVDENTLSGFTLGFSEDSPSLEVVTGSGFASDFTWNLGSDVSPISITALNATEHVIDTTGTQLLGTLQFVLDGAFTSGTIDIDLTLTDAQRGTFPDMVVMIPPSEITIRDNGGTLNVSSAAVPEPASLAMMGLAACGALGLRRRRRGSQVEQVA